MDVTLVGLTGLAHADACCRKPDVDLLRGHGRQIVERAAFRGRELPWFEIEHVKHADRGAGTDLEWRLGMKGEPIRRSGSDRILQESHGRVPRRHDRGVHPRDQGGRWLVSLFR